MNLSNLRPPKGQKHKNQRIGQGMGTGRGKYSGRGAKGAKSVSGYSFELWWVVLSPAGTPPEVVNRLNTEVNKILASPEMKDFFLREGAEPSIVSPVQFATVIARDIAQFQKIAKQASIKAD